MENPVRKVCLIKCHSREKDAPLNVKPGPKYDNGEQKDYRYAELHMTTRIQSVKYLGTINPKELFDSFFEISKVPSCFLGYLQCLMSFS